MCIRYNKSQSHSWLKLSDKWIYRTVIKVSFITLDTDLWFKKCIQLWIWLKSRTLVRQGAIPLWTWTETSAVSYWTVFLWKSCYCCYLDEFFVFVFRVNLSIQIHLNGQTRSLEFHQMMKNKCWHSFCSWYWFIYCFETSSTYVKLVIC
jgi:hypothetical protein